MAAEGDAAGETPAEGAPAEAAPAGRLRADRLLVERGLFESRARAQAAIGAGLVRADGRTVARPSDLLARDAVLDAAEPYPWVSRGGLKLIAALEAGGIEVAGRTALDVGASTGGFTDVLLARGARRVHAVDVGRDQLHPRLRARPEVVSLEATDIRTLPRDAIAEPVDLVVIDVSFIALAQVLAPALDFAAAGATLIALVKPQFEVGRAQLSKGGIVRDAGARAQALAGVEAHLAGLGWPVRLALPSPIAGGDGNAEFLVIATRAGG